MAAEGCRRARRTQVSDQYRGDGVAPRGLAFGMPAIRVDGNDPFAVYAAVQRAREMALEGEGRPALIEAMTYRIGAHSTSDDDSKYRAPDAPEAGWDSERAYWEARSPIIRFGRYLRARGWYDGQAEEEIRKQARKQAIRALNDAQAVAKPHSRHLFTDVYDELPWHLAEQEEATRQHMLKYAHVDGRYSEYLDGNEKQVVDLLKLLIKRVAQIKELTEIKTLEGDGAGEDLKGIADFNEVENPDEEEIMPLSR